MKMKRTDRMIERHKTWVALRLARKAFVQEAAEHQQITDEELSRLYRQTEALPPAASRVRRDARLRAAVVALLVALPLSLVISFGISCVRPATDGYAMNRGADRADTVVKIENMMYNT